MRKDQLRMLRDVTCIVETTRRLFQEGCVYSFDFAPWLPQDSYESYQPKPPVPMPKEIVVDYDG